MNNTSLFLIKFEASGLLAAGRRPPPRDSRFFTVGADALGGIKVRNFMGR